MKARKDSIQDNVSKKKITAIILGKPGKNINILYSHVTSFFLPSFSFFVPLSLIPLRLLKFKELIYNRAGIPVHPDVCCYQLALYAPRWRPDVCSCWQLLLEAPEQLMDWQRH